jgi:hypothetical protein
VGITFDIRDQVLTSHEFCEVAKSFFEDHISVLWHSFFELLLQIATSVLILAESRDVTLQIFQTSSGIAIN